MNITFDLQYESSFDKNEKEDGKTVSQEAPLTRMFKSS